MSVNPDGMTEIDYSDFEYQQIYHRHQQDPTGDGANSQVKSDFEVLGGIGGLDNNEVAELVWMEAQVSVQHFQEDADQDVGSETFFEGIVGANLPATTALLPADGDQTGEIINTNNTSASLNGSDDSEDRVFAPFAVAKTPAFDDQTNGPGGGGGHSTLVVKRPFRNMVGRGPVLDSSDDLSLLTSLEQDDEIIVGRGKVSLHCIWDVAETSDAGRAFSVPR